MDYAPWTFEPRPEKLMAPVDASIHKRSTIYMRLLPDDMGNPCRHTSDCVYGTVAKELSGSQVTLTNYAWSYHPITLFNLHTELPRGIRNAHFMLNKHFVPKGLIPITSKKY